MLIKGLCQVEESSRISCKELASWLAKYETQIIDLQEFTVNELPEKLSKLTPERPRDSKVQQQYPSYVQPSANNYITAPVRSELKQPDLNAPRPNYSGQFVSQGTYQQYNFEQYNPSTYVSSGSGLNQQRGPPSQVSNVNPSIITFQKDNARSALEQPAQSQLKTNINLQQIDEQLQMSRKLFPSWFFIFINQKDITDCLGFLAKRVHLFYYRRMQSLRERWRQRWKWCILVIALTVSWMACLW